jgi:multiple sugar transport system ATP-binding protein
MAIVEIDRVKKSYGSLEIIHGVNIRIDDGEFVVLVGPSGCGKSTLLRMTAGLENISGGEIRIGHNVVNDLPPKDRDIAMVFQNYALYPHMTVGQNMGFSLKLRKTPSAMIDAKVKEAADILGLRPLLDRYPRQLSGGQRQRVAMGRAIVRDPQVFLFDEPLSNLDAKLRVQMRAEIKALHQRLHTTTIYVTHDQIEAMTMADKIVVMLDGHVEQIGAPLEVYDHPDSQFVAGFIGSPAMNFLSGRIETSGGGSVVTKDGARIPASGLSQISDGQEVTLGIRPEHLEVVPPETAGAFTGEIQVVEPTGSETMISANVAGAQMVAVLRSRHRFQAGERISLRPEPGRIHLFDPTTERGLRIK